MPDHDSEREKRDDRQDQDAKHSIPPVVTIAVRHNLPQHFPSPEPQGKRGEDEQANRELEKRLPESKAFDLVVRSQPREPQ